MEPPHELFDKLVGHPHANLDKAVSSMVHEFETKRNTASTSVESLVSGLRMVPAALKDAQEGLDSDLDVANTKAQSVASRLLELQKAVSSSSQGGTQFNPTLKAKEAFQKDIDEAREAFDQEMALRHADAVKQYVGTFVQQIGPN
ncbi:hypothetical protein BGZ94_009261 [Podila epigama]|nr:hypothetical protein BGZ94_009261 [Podila epigama]